MPTYNIGGHTISTDQELDPTGIDDIAKQMGVSGSANTDNASIPDEASKGFMSTLYGVGQGIADIVQKVNPASSDPLLSDAQKADATQRLKTAADQYKQQAVTNAPAVPSASDIHSWHDAALWAASKLGGMTPYALAALTGGVPAAATFGAAQSGEQEAQQPGSTPASITAAAGIGGLGGAIRAPFAGMGSGIVGRTAANLAGGAAQGAVLGAGSNIPQAAETGNPADAIPSSSQLWDSILGGAVGGGAFGAAHGTAERLIQKISAPGAPAPDPVDVQAQLDANGRLKQRIQGQAAQNGYDLNNPNYDAGDGAKATLDTVHNGLASDIRWAWNTIAPTLGEPTDLDSSTAQGQLNGIIRSAVNKVKGRVGPDDLQTLQNAVGGTQEGQHLVDLVRQSNTLTDMFNGGLKGGVSRFTDYLNPLSHGGPENGFGSVLARATNGRLSPWIEASVLASHPALWPVAAVQAAAAGGGRAIDAMTGRRSTVARFVNTTPDPQPLNFGTSPSIVQNQAQAAARADAFRASQVAVNTQAQQRTALQRASDAYDRQQAQQQAATTQAAQDQREFELRQQNRLDNNPGVGGFDRSIYDQTGLLPHDTTRGMFELNRTGRVTPQEFHSFFQNPRDLMAGNAGNHIIDMLDGMARKGQLQRDLDWNSNTAQPSPEPPQSVTIYNPEAYAAQAAGNQARATAAQERVANSGHTPEVKQQVNDAIGAISRTNNRADAQEIHDNAVNSLAHTPEAQTMARQELSPLVKQIKHATPESAAANSIPKGSDLSPLTTDVTRDGNALTRTLAAAYKLKAGIDKPAYDGRREPDTGYLKTVADFHDQAVHDPNDPAVKASYDALARETVAQFKSLGGLNVETWKGQGEPYADSKEMMRDVADNRHLWFLPTDSAFGANGEEIAHPMRAPAGLKTTDGHPLLVNDAFRIVHDFYGHTQHGFQFGPVGEYNAFREHAQMYSDAALPALAAETLGQNAWANFGPHLRGLDGSLPKAGQPGFVPASQRPFSDQKAYAFPPELLARDPNIGREFIDHLYDVPQGAIKQGLDVSAGKPQLHDLIPGFKGIVQFLTPSEREGMITRTANTLVKHLTNLPSAAEMASVAYSGRAKRGWYQQSAKAIVSIFGQEDAPRFAALLAALSPQTSVESNLTNALNVWRGWIEADRPKDQASIMRVLGENVEGDKGPGSVLDAWVNNSVRALTAEDGAPVTISGPKVASFMHNLLGEVNEVTNDTWMANWAGIKQTVFKGAETGTADTIGNLYGNGPGYMAMNSLARRAADILTKRTGETWTPAEVQETVWSWAKALSEKANSQQSATDLVKQGNLSHDEIASVPDFEKLFVNDTYGRILDQAGYGDYVDNLKDTVERRSQDALGNGPGGSPFSAEGSGISQTALLKHLVSSAKRLDALKSGNAYPAARSADVAGRFANTPQLNPGEIVVSNHDNLADANTMAAAMGKTGRPVRVAPFQGGASVVLGPKPQADYPSAAVPPERAYTDPEGRQGAANFVAGIESPDGTTRGLSDPEIRAVSKSIARLVEGGIPAPGQNGVYDKGNNTIRVYGGLSPEEHGRVLSHETGHAIEALAGVAEQLGLTKKVAPEYALNLVKELSHASRLERPQLWADSAALKQTWGSRASSVPEYRARFDELLADGIRHYMTNPASMKKVAPEAAKFIRAVVNPSKIGKVIAFAGLGGVALPGIIAQALSSLYNNQQQQDT